MSAPFRRVLLAGTAGGVGTTTVTALLFSRLRDRSTGAPALLDHTAGDLGARLPEGDEVRVLSDQLLHDLGRHALPAGAAGLVDPATMLVVVSAATPVGCLLAAGALEAIGRSHGPAGAARTVVVLAGVFGRHRIRGHLRDLAAAPVPASSVLLLPPDPALAVGGPIPLSRLSRSTGRSVDALLASIYSATTRSAGSGSRG